MIQGISGTAMPPPPPARTDRPLTQSQQDTITETLSLFDSENLTESDANSIIEAFNDAGISPGSELEKLMADQGFDARSVGQLANTEESATSGASNVERDVKSMLEYMTVLLEDALDNTSSNSLSEEQELEIYNQVLEKFGLSEDDTIINVSA